MRKRLVILTMAFSCMMPATLCAQGTDNDMETDAGGRLSVELDRKIKKGVHVMADAQLRMSDKFNKLGRYQAGLGMSYKINDWLKAQAGYVLIEVMNSSGEWNPRHRVYLDLTGTLKSGQWRFSLKEKLQLTHRSGVNAYQTTPNALSLKSRIKAEYSGSGSVSPYVYAEFRTALNDPSCSANWNGTSYSDYSFTGYNDIYLNRVRGALGLEWKLDKKNSLDFVAMLDYCHDKNIDTNSKGTKLKSLTYDRTIMPQVGVSYKFSF